MKSTSCAALGLLLAAAPLSGCLTAHPRLGAPARAPEFRPEVFFAGHTRGLGTLVVRGGTPQLVRVESYGQPESDGTFRLDQTITFGDDRVERRTWRMRRVGARGYVASLTDATGEATGEVDGNVFRLRYLLRRPGVVMHQRLHLQPDGRTALNLATVRVLGVPWARLTEQITRVDG